MIIIMVGTTDSIRPGYHPQDRLSDSTVRSLISRVLDRRSDRLDPIDSIEPELGLNERANRTRNDGLA